MVYMHSNIVTNLVLVMRLLLGIAAEWYEILKP